ncbi:MAG: hypothetical protein J6K39_03850 [Clostridia bacterium]|nr:hypothetical protein [Clostridia bacterium]
MVALYVIIILAVVGFAVYYICREYIKKPRDEANGGSKGVLKNKKSIENMVANVESVIVYANGNDELCRRLVEVKDNIRFFNPTTNQKALLVDSKIANKLDDLKIVVAKDNTQETCFRMLEEVEAYIVQRKKEEQA